MARSATTTDAFTAVAEASRRVNNRHGSAVITLPSDPEIMITRVFDAPADLVFKALTTPELVKRWWGFETSEWLVCEVDLKVGGQWRFVIREGDIEVGFGEYRVIAAPHPHVSTEVYEGFPDAGSLNTATLDETDGVTTEHRAAGMRDSVSVRYSAVSPVGSGPMVRAGPSDSPGEALRARALG
ncbi:MAG: SRPBCC domain-containing protein [Acidimicrobiales bacterium]